MQLYRTVDGDRIDLVVLRHYGSVEHLKEVLEANPKLSKNDSMILKAGEIIKLPTIQKKETFLPISEDEEDLLW